MTEQSNAELIAEAEEASASEHEELGEDAYVGGLLDRLAIALKAADALADREPSADEAVVVARVIRDHDEESLTCYDHDGTCCPCGKHDMSHAEWEFHRARAALLAAQQVRRG